ncbi:MAG TPA: SPFH domain-containing protein [Candidatus Methylomirabilis sp.]|nr:SPFH domain-containing protein [Candidatus Methylomirabilis sp.]
MTRPKLTLLILTLAALAVAGCGKGAPEIANRDYVHQTELKDVRLGGGVPLTLALSIRWRVEDGAAFTKQFADPEQYGQLVFDAKARELAGKIANAHASLAAVFRPEREKFVRELKETLTQKLGEPGIAVKEVILAEILFPKNFTDALEVTATKDLELARIREKNTLDLEQAKAAQSQAQAEGQVQVEKARIEGKVAEINAQTEDKRRLSQVAKAETEAQVLERRTKAEVERQRLLALREVERQRDLNRVELEKQANLKDLELKRQKEFDQVQIAKEKELAALTAGNPAYASFLVNRELASKVQIAVLPLGTESGVLGNIIQHSLRGGSQRK